jgi:choline dehydrogenase
MSTDTRDTGATDAFGARVRANQLKLGSKLKDSYDFIVCGSGTSGSVVARRLAENRDVSVLLLEAGGTDDVASVMNASQWPSNLGSELDWGFESIPNSRLNGRTLALSMGKVLGGGSSINGMHWSRGHKNDWDYFAIESGDAGWCYQSVLGLYRRIEDWRGAPDPARRGTRGLVYVEPPKDPNPIAPAMLNGARSVGIPTFDDQNGCLMEGEGGGALVNMLLHDGPRLSIFRAYTYPFMDRSNLTVLTRALVTRVAIEGKHATGVEFILNGRVEKVRADLEVVLSLGAINTPKVLMQSGVGPESELQRFGIHVSQHLPGVGGNFQDHYVVASCVWEYAAPMPPRNNFGEATVFWKSDPRLPAPDLQLLQMEVPINTPALAQTGVPPASWIMAPVLLRPASVGRLRLTGAGPDDPIEIDADTYSEPADLRALAYGVALCREIGNSPAMRPFAKREVMPGNLTPGALETFIRNRTMTSSHQTCTAKMGRDSMAVVSGQLKVYGINNLRIADGSIFPHVPTGNTMAPCVIVGERAAEMIKSRHRI